MKQRKTKWSPEAERQKGVLKQKKTERSTETKNDRTEYWKRIQNAALKQRKTERSTETERQNMSLIHWTTEQSTEKEIQNAALKHRKKNRTTVLKWERHKRVNQWKINERLKPRTTNETVSKRSTESKNDKNGVPNQRMTKTEYWNRGLGRTWSVKLVKREYSQFQSLWT